MEKSDITLEESFALYNEGMQLLKQCNETIDAVEKKFRFWTRMEKFMSFKEIQKEKQHRSNRFKSISAQGAGYQEVIMDAMSYSMLAGGKRLRPMLMQETYRMFGGTDRVIEPFMAAIEMIHTSSLVHDDLPCMDDDMIRRGKAQYLGQQYGEDIGVLGGRCSDDVRF